MTRYGRPGRLRRRDLGAALEGMQGVQAPSAACFDVASSSLCHTRCRLDASNVSGSILKLD